MVSLLSSKLVLLFIFANVNQRALESENLQITFIYKIKQKRNHGNTLQKQYLWPIKLYALK